MIQSSVIIIAIFLFFSNKVMSELGDVLLRAKIQHFLWQKGKTIYF
ncbi:hypothetical protein CAPGI0001_2586 [Capnocytophaga gingivalis ATCC 33624]|nr:hypothetical protein CAPGI0001_2586 [Capnocytophaga gingivalis ATCC 33624]